MVTGWDNDTQSKNAWLYSVTGLSKACYTAWKKIFVEKTFEIFVLSIVIWFLISDKPGFVEAVEKAVQALVRNVGSGLMKVRRREIVVVSVSPVEMMTTRTVAMVLIMTISMMMMMMMMTVPMVTLWQNYLNHDDKNLVSLKDRNADEKDKLQLLGVIVLWSPSGSMNDSRGTLT